MAGVVKRPEAWEFSGYIWGMIVRPSGLTLCRVFKAPSLLSPYFLPQNSPYPGFCITSGGQLNCSLMDCLTPGLAMIRHNASQTR